MQERYVATADLGSSKIALSVSKIAGDDIQVIYYKETPSDGIRYSCVFNPTRASEALRKAIDQAQKDLDIKIMQIVIGLPRYSVRQEVAPAAMERSNPGSCITEEEVLAIKNMALDSYPLEDSSKEVIYGAVAQSFTADDMFQQSEEDVVGSPADTLEGNFKIFVGAKRAVNNIDIMLNSLGVASARKVFLPSAMAEAVLSDEEKDNGVALIEQGAGVTSVSIYKGRILRYYGSIPFGAKNITTDIKYECGFKEELAENIKLAFGACIPEKLQSMGDKILQINDEETGTYEHLRVKYLSEIITCREKEIIESILFLIQESGYAERLRNGIVLTGGGANMANLANLIKEMSGYNVRIGYPKTRHMSIEGCPGITETSAVSTIAMILNSFKDEHLNCIEELHTGKEEQEPEADVTGTVFEDNGKEQVKPAKTASPKPASKFKITWRKPKFIDTVEGAVGGLFDQME